MRKPNLLKGFVKLQMVDSILNGLRRQIIRSRPVGVVQCASLDEGVSKIKKKRGDFFFHGLVFLFTGTIFAILIWNLTNINTWSYLKGEYGKFLLSPPPGQALRCVQYLRPPSPVLRPLRCSSDAWADNHLLFISVARPTGVLHGQLGRSIFCLSTCF